MLVPVRVAAVSAVVVLLIAALGHCPSFLTLGGWSLNGIPLRLRYAFLLPVPQSSNEVYVGVWAARVEHGMCVPVHVLHAGFPHSPRSRPY